MISTATSLLSVLPPGSRDHLLTAARDVNFPAGERLFQEGSPADRFWIVRTGTVILDMAVPGRRPAAVDTLHPGDLVGWSWLIPPYTWHLGAETLSPVRALEFDAPEVRRMCDADPELGRAVATRVAEITGHRLQQARARLLDLFAPHGAAP
ncbi:cyclic nucleotide-binding domain-containing protein [Streptomyces sp. TR06-5]|uniref:cyclic nucleotide-binding domain-containing protein n=1 Tax=unclassified Streptomyces TaxID=2593676 RepID=UPI0039A2C0AB